MLRKLWFTLTVELKIIHKKEHKTESGMDS